MTDVAPYFVPGRRPNQCAQQAIDAVEVNYSIAPVAADAMYGIAGRQGRSQLIRKTPRTIGERLFHHETPTLAAHPPRLHIGVHLDPRLPTPMAPNGRAREWRRAHRTGRRQLPRTHPRSRSTPETRWTSSSRVDLQIWRRKPLPQRQHRRTPERQAFKVNDYGANPPPHAMEPAR